MSKNSRNIPKSTSFEDALGELEKIVESLESGEQTLELSLQQFERGISLSRFCQNNLDAAEQQVKILLDQDKASGTEDAIHTDELVNFDESAS